VTVPPATASLRPNAAATPGIVMAPAPAPIIQSPAPTALTSKGWSFGNFSSRFRILFSQRVVETSDSPDVARRRSDGCGFGFGLTDEETLCTREGLGDLEDLNELVDFVRAGTGLEEAAALADVTEDVDTLR